jgi:formylmethanofuran dehydrogenase subunit E
MYYIRDNYDMWEQHDREEQAKLDELPVCEICQEPIQQEKAIYYNDQYCCEECEREFWQNIREDFLEEVSG